MRQINYNKFLIGKNYTLSEKAKRLFLMAWLILFKLSGFILFILFHHPLGDKVI